MATPNSLAELSRELAQAVETGGAGVVAVHGRPQVPSSGILWRDGIVVTTDHTLKRHEDITITLPNKTTLPATLAGRDPASDIAVLRISENSTPAAKLADEASVKVGNFVLALGRPGEYVTASFGVVSAFGTVRGPGRRLGHIDRLIRPDVCIYLGFSGGALVDAEGRVVGMNTSALGRGAAFTIPASTVSRTIEDLLSQGRIRRGFLGVGLQPVRLPDGRTGLIILSIELDGPASRAGIFVGDVLLSLEGQAVNDTDDVQAHLGGDRIGKPITAEIVRGGAPLSLTVVPGERHAGGPR